MGTGTPSSGKQAKDVADHQSTVKRKNMGWSIMIFFLSFLVDRTGRYSEHWAVDLESIHIANHSGHVQLAPPRPLPPSFNSLIHNVQSFEYGTGFSFQRIIPHSNKNLSVPANTRSFSFYFIFILYISGERTYLLGTESVVSKQSSLPATIHIHT